MRCDQSRRLFSAYWDDEVTQAEREWLEGHFSGCAKCRSDYESLARVLELTGSLPRVEVKPDLAARVLARARRQPPHADRIPSTTPRWVPVTAAAALVGLGAAALLQWTGRLPEVRPGVSQDPVAISEPVLVSPAPVATRPVPEAAGEPVAAAVSDSLFDHTEDIEFILDPVTLRRGRAHTVSRLARPEVKGEVAVITF